MNNEQKPEEKPIPIAATFADTLRGDKLYALLARGADFIKIPIRHMSANDRAAIDARYPDPLPPPKFNAQGGRYLDVYDEKFRKGCDEAALKRMKARLAFLVPDEFIGTKDEAEKIARVWSGWSESDILAVDRQGMNPYETREEGVQAKEEELAPFGSTGAEGSPG